MLPIITLFGQVSSSLYPMQISMSGGLEFSRLGKAEKTSTRHCGFHCWCVHQHECIQGRPPAILELSGTATDNTFFIHDNNSPCHYRSPEEDISSGVSLQKSRCHRDGHRSEKSDTDRPFRF